MGTQARISSLLVTGPDFAGGNQVHLVNAQVVPNPSPTDTPAGATLPFGFFQFQVVDIPQFAALGIDLFLPTPHLDGNGNPITSAAQFTYWRYGYTPAIDYPHLYEFLYQQQSGGDDANYTGAEFISSTHIRLHFVDGARGDDDLTADGVITDAGGTAVATSPAAAFVIAFYQDLFHRYPEPAGFASWTGMLAAGATRAEIVQGIYNSLEHREGQVNQLYQTYLHRSPDSAGQALWVSELLGGASEITIEEAFLTSPEYAADHPDNASDVTALYSGRAGARARRRRAGNLGDRQLTSQRPDRRRPGLPDFA
jgi:hypothetical protein